MNKKTITIEELKNGKLRVSVDGPAYIVNGANLSVREITPCSLAPFRPAPRQSRQEYSAAHCTGNADWHRKGTCDGNCHHENCLAPADFLVRWKADDGQQRCMPFCIWHAHTTSEVVGIAVLHALNLGIVQDLTVYTSADPLPNGKPRCTNTYGYFDERADWVNARCTNEGTMRMRVVPSAGAPYDALLCSQCAADLGAWAVADLDTRRRCLSSANTDGKA